MVLLDLKASSSGKPVTSTVACFAEKPCLHAGVCKSNFAQSRYDPIRTLVSVSLSQMKVSDLLRKRQDRGAVPLLVSQGLTDPEASSLSASCSSPLGLAGNLVVPGSAAGAEGRSACGRRVLCETRGGRQGVECAQRLTSEDVLKDELGGMVDGDGGADADEVSPLVGVRCRCRGGSSWS